MRRAILLTLSLGALLAGCGSSSSSGGSVRDTELSYFPPGAPFVGLLQTDPNGKAIQDANAFVGRFPFGKLGLAAAESALSRRGVNYQRDIKPLLGNPVALGAASDSNISGSSFLLVFVAKDEGKLKQLTTRPPAPQSAGDYDGAKLYETGSYALALDGATAVLSTSLDRVKAALDRHKQHAGISSEAFSKALSGLPQDTILQMYGSLAGVLSTPKAAKAKLVPWVAAIRSYGVSVRVDSNGANVQFRVDTSGSSLTADQLPLASGSSAPNVSSVAPVAGGVNDLSHLISFVLAAQQATNPAKYAALLKRQARVKARTGVDVARDVYPQFTGTLEVDYNPPSVLARADLKDPAGAARTLSKLGASAGDLYGSANKVTSLGGGFYSVRSGKRTVNFGIVGSRLVAGTASPTQLRAFAGAPAAAVPGAQGPAAFRVAVGSLVSLALAASHRSSSLPPAQSIFKMFGDMTGWAANDQSGLHGSLSVALK